VSVGTKQRPMTAAERKAEEDYLRAEREAIQADGCTLDEWTAIGGDEATWKRLRAPKE
jgi:hypothetical protein